MDIFLRCQEWLYCDNTNCPHRTPHTHNENCDAVNENNIRLEECGKCEVIYNEPAGLPAGR